MKYRRVEIARTRDEWGVIFADIPGDREDKPQSPHPLGFYYFPYNVSKKEAFATLHSFMVARYEEDIVFLTKKLEGLKALTIVEEER